MFIEVTAADISLYHVAAKHLRDATQWWRIAQMNGMDDPDLSGLETPVSLLLPAVSMTLTNGVSELSA